MLQMTEVLILVKWLSSVLYLLNRKGWLLLPFFLKDNLTIGY
jgi:hypothetical protein